MPRRPEWILRIPDAVRALEHFPSPLVDRAAVERLLGVHRRTAIRLLAQLDAWQLGRTFAVDPEHLRDHLLRIAASEEYRRESRRVRKLSQQVAEAKRLLPARQVRLDPVLTSRWRCLPPQIRLRRHRLEVDFNTPAELLQHLHQLSEAIAGDYAGFLSQLQADTDSITS